MNSASSQRSSKKQQRAVMGGLFFVGLLILHNNVVSFHLASLRASQQYERATSKRIKRENSVTNELKAKRVELRKLLEDHGSRQNVLFNSDEAREFIRALEAIGIGAGCEVLRIDYNVPLRREAVTAADSNLVISSRTVALEVVGGYGDITKFIEALGGQSHKVWLDRLRLANGRSNSGLLKGSIMLTIYISQEKESGGDEQAPQDNRD